MTHYTFHLKGLWPYLLSCISRKRDVKETSEMYMHGTGIIKKRKIASKTKDFAFPFPDILVNCALENVAQ